MLAATKRAKKQKVTAGALILKQGSPVESFFMIVSGEVDVFARNEQSREMRLARLGRGQFFGEVELTHGGNSIASVRASSRGAELALLPRELLQQLMDGSPPMRQALNGLAAARLAENKRSGTGEA